MKTRTRRRNMRYDVRGKLSRADLLIKFEAYISNSGDTECWGWDGAMTDGYAMMYDGSGNRLAHRLSYETYFNTTIPPEMWIDHTCLNRGCVNPAHLQVVTPSKNIKRAYKGTKPKVALARLARTHCKHGHPFSGDNLRVEVTPQGHRKRRCRECVRAQGRREGCKPRKGADVRKEAEMLQGGKS